MIEYDYCSVDDVLEVLPDVFDTETLNDDTKIFKAINHAGGLIDPQLKHIYKTKLEMADGQDPLTWQYPNEVRLACANYAASFILRNYFSGQGGISKESIDFREGFIKDGDKYLKNLKDVKYYDSTLKPAKANETKARAFFFDDDENDNEEYILNNAFITKVSKDGFK